MLSADGFNAFPQAVPFLGYAVGAPQSLPWPIPVTFRQSSGGLFPDIAVVVWVLVYFYYWLSRLWGIELIYGVRSWVYVPVFAIVIVGECLPVVATINEERMDVASSSRKGSDVT